MNLLHQYRLFSFMPLLLHFLIISRLEARHMGRCIKRGQVLIINYIDQICYNIHIKICKGKILHTITLNIQDNIYEHIMYLLKSLNPKDIEIIDSKLLEIDSNFDVWTKDEINNIGKIGFNSKSFVEDSEDYSKW